MVGSVILQDVVLEIRSDRVRFVCNAVMYDGLDDVLEMQHSKRALYVVVYLG